jgi:hypothetical protein
VVACEIELSVLASGLEGVRLNRGQEVLVTAMATSGARVQLALTPAGSGKTIAMQVLASVWTEGGCNVLGLAPSAAAAAALAEATGVPCETFAKLTHDLAHVPNSGLVSSIGPGTLVVIDEADTADTLTLASVIELTVARGASVRLIGDDRQLAAIGTGGLLRDVASTHGAIRLNELVRFADPAEARRRCRFATAIGPRWGSTWTTTASTSATWRRACRWARLPDVHAPAPARASTSSASSTSPPPAGPCPSTTPPPRSATGSRTSPPRRGSAGRCRRSTPSRARACVSPAHRWGCRSATASARQIR